MKTKRAVLVLAAGQGTRMRSTLPKMLQPLGGVPLLGRLLSTLEALEPAKIGVVYGEQGEMLQQALDQEKRFIWVRQAQALGTAHAVLQALPFLQDCEQVLICYGDTPLIRAETLHRLLAMVSMDSVGFMTMMAPNPQGYGRVLRDHQDKVLRIVEEKEASLQERTIQEVNAGFFVLPAARLTQWIPLLVQGTGPVDKEYYMTDIIQMAHRAGLPIHTLQSETPWELSGVNDKIQLATLERHFQYAEAKRLMQQGVTLMDPHRFDLRGDVRMGQDVVIDINVLLEGCVRIGNRVSIGPHVCIKNTTIQDGATILAHTIIDGATLGPGVTVGPFARLRPGTVLSEKVRIGNFVELKNAQVGLGTKINHLSYVGDAVIGKAVNIGAGTITCNYDGHRKHQTTIEDKVHIGANTALIAPLTIGHDTVVGAGTILKRDVPPKQCIHNRVEHRMVDKPSLLEKSEKKED